MPFSNLRLAPAKLLNEYFSVRKHVMEHGAFTKEAVLYHSWKPGFLEIDGDQARIIGELRTLAPNDYSERHRTLASDLEAMDWHDDAPPQLEALAERTSEEFEALQNRYEMLALLTRVQALKPKVVVEIGTAAGGMFYCFAQLADPEAILISIDLPGGPFGGGNTVGESHLYRTFLGQRQRAHFIRDRSFHYASLQDVQAAIGDNPIDFLFIDGDHSYGAVIADYTMYSPLVRKGGLIALHDIVLDPHVWGRGKDSGQAWKYLRQGKHTTEIFDPNGSREPPVGPPKDHAEMASTAWGIGLIHP